MRHFRFLLAACLIFQAQYANADDVLSSAEAQTLARNKMVGKGLDPARFNLKEQSGSFVAIRPKIDPGLLPARDGSAWVFVPSEGESTVDYRFDGYDMRSAVKPKGVLDAVEIAKRIMDAYSIGSESYTISLSGAFKFTAYPKNGVKNASGRYWFVDVQTPIVFVVDNPRMVFSP
jgi:hypothetical protein